MSILVTGASEGKLTPFFGKQPRYVLTYDSVSFTSIFQYTPVVIDPEH
jgi:hypothetical protein